MQTEQAISRRLPSWPLSARRVRLEESFQPISVGGAMRVYQDGGEAAPTATAQASGGPGGGNGAPAGTAVGQAGGEPMVSIPVSQLRTLGLDQCDPGNLVAIVKRHLSYERDGWHPLIKDARADGRNLSGYGLRKALEERNWDLANPTPAPAPDPAPAYAPAPQSYGQDPYNAGIDPTTGQPWGAIYGAPQADPRFDQLTGIVQKQQETLQQLQADQKAWREEQAAAAKRAERADLFATRDAEQSAAIAQALKRAGIERKAAETEWFGQKREVDPDYDFGHEPRVLKMASDLWRRDMTDPDDPRLQEFQAGLGVPRRFCEQAAEFYVSQLAASDSTAASREADRQRLRNLPEGALPASGTGGQPAKSYDEMSEDEKMEASFAAAAAGGRLRGKY